MEQSTTTTPKRRQNRPPRKEGPRMLQDGITDIIVTPNAKRSSHKRRDHTKEFQNTNLMSPPPLPDQLVPSIETLDLSSDLSASTQKKRRSHKKKHLEREQVEQIMFRPQSPPVIPQSLAQVTPVKALQMYAGPTFHASPAASSLPMPKFFSQAMKPERTSEPPLSTSDESSGESSSQTGGDSPTLRNSLRALVNTPARREVSPLDIFFAADRQEKAQKARLESTLARERAKSASPAVEAFRNTLPPSSKSQTSLADDNHAKTQALKLLLFPPVHQTTSATTSPFLDTSQRPGTIRSTSETSTPTRSSMNSNGSPFDKRPFYDSPNLSTPPSSARPNQARRPLPHHLRQELLNSLPLDQSPDIQTRSDIYSPFTKA